MKRALKKVGDAARMLGPRLKNSKVGRVLTGSAKKVRDAFARRRDHLRDRSSQRRQRVREQREQRDRRENSNDSKSKRLSLIVARIKPRIERLLRRGVGQRAMGALLSGMRLWYRLTKLAMTNSRDFILTATLNPSMSAGNGRRVQAEAILGSYISQVDGLDDWLLFNDAKAEQQFRDHILNEAREARRLAEENPGSRVQMGLEANPIMRPGTNDPLKDFDLSVSRSGKVARSVEVKTIEKPVSGFGDLSEGVRHGAEKAAQRELEGLPIPGKLEASIYMKLAVGDKPMKGTIRRVRGDGTVELLRKDDPSKIIKTENVFDDFLANLPKIKDNQKLHRVNISDPGSGVSAVFENVNGKWARVR